MLAGTQAKGCMPGRVWRGQKGTSSICSAAARHTARLEGRDLCPFLKILSVLTTDAGKVPKALAEWFERAQAGPTVLKHATERYNLAAK